MSSSDISRAAEAEAGEGEVKEAPVEKQGKPVEVSTSFRVGFVLLGLGFLFHGLGFCSPYWHLSEDISYGDITKTNYGLWRWCKELQKYRSVPYTYCYSLFDGEHYVHHVRATQFFETVGFLGGIAAIILLILAVCITSCRDRRILPILSAVAAVAAAGCIILGCIIFGAKDGERPFLAWAFALAIVGGIFYGLAGVLVFVATFFIKR